MKATTKAIINGINWTMTCGEIETTLNRIIAEEGRENLKSVLSKYSDPLHRLMAIAEMSKKEEEKAKKKIVKRFNDIELMLSSFGLRIEGGINQWLDGFDSWTKVTNRSGVEISWLTACLTGGNSCKEIRKRIVAAGM